MALGLKAFIAIIESPQKKENINLVPGIESMYVQNRFSTLKKVLNKDPLTDLLKQPEKKAILDAFYSTLWHLDTQFGKTYLKTSISAAQKYLSDQSNNEKKAKLILYKQCITIIPKFVISDDVLNQLGELLARVSIHTDEDTANCAFAVIKILIVEYNNFRSKIIHNVAFTYLQEVPQNCNEVNYHIISNIRALIQIWRTCISNENSKISTSDGFHSIEAFCLICLCTNDSIQKQMTCQLLKETKYLFVYFQQEKILQYCVYEDIFKYLVEKKNSSAEGYSNFDLLKLFDLTFPATPWFQILGLLFRDSQLSYQCSNTIKLAQKFGFPRFLQCYSAVESIVGYMEISSRLSLTRTKKTISFGDIENLQLTFTIYCSPSYTQFGSNILTASDQIFDMKNYSSSGHISAAFDKIINTIKAEDPEISDACADVICLTHSSVIPLFLKSLLPTLKEITDTKIEQSSRKRKRRDNIIFKFLKIFSYISKNKHLASYIKTSEIKDIQIFIDFCDFCRDHIFPAYEPNELSTKITDLANIISCISCGLYHQSKLDIIQSMRVNYYKLFTTNLDLDQEMKLYNFDERESILEAIFTLLYTKNLFKDFIFGKKIREICDRLHFAIKMTELRNKYLVLNTVEIILNLNEYNPGFINWIIMQIYSNSNDFSRQLYFILLDFYENHHEVESNFVQILSLICVFLTIADSSIYFKITKFLLTIQSKNSEEEVINFPSSQNEEIPSCVKFVFGYIFKIYKKYIISIISEFFHIFKNCHFIYQRQILVCLEHIFKGLIFESHSDYPYTNNIIFEFPECAPMLSVKFSTSIFIVNNLMYLTRDVFFISKSIIHNTIASLEISGSRSRAIRTKITNIL